MVSMLHWLAACEWWSSPIAKGDPDPADFGIFGISGTEKHMAVMVYCHDYTHYKNLPEVCIYRGMVFARAFWDAAMRRATYRNDTPAALGARTKVVV